jgi:hypothetical protein
MQKLEYQSSNSLLVINSSGELRQLFVPFRVIVIDSDILHVQKGCSVFVEAVKPDVKERILFRVFHLWIPYSVFELIEFGPMK